MSTKELSDADKAKKKDKVIASNSPSIVITKAYGKWKKGDRPTVLKWKAEKLITLGVAKNEGIVSRTINKLKNG